MSEYGHESTPREPFAYRLCPFCGAVKFAIYRDTFRYRCQSCGVEGTIEKTPEGEYPSPPVVVDVHPWRKGYG